MVEYQEAETEPVFVDRSTGLIVFGILEIVFGGLSALVALLMLLAMVVAGAFDPGDTPPMFTGTMIPGLLFYVVLSVWFITMGIGSLKARRWARALLVVSSWLWLIGGVGGLIGMLLVMPGMYEQMGEAGDIPQGVVVFMKYAMTGFAAIFGVLLPSVLLLFYGSKNVKATCEARDHKVRWTDRCPLPVLAVSLWLYFMAASMLSTGLYGWAIPFFGHIVTGLAGAAVAIVTALIFGYSGWGTYRLHAKAWWVAFVVCILSAVSSVLTFSRVSLVDFWAGMNLPAEQLEMMKGLDFMQSPLFVLYGGAWFAVCIGYLLYVKKYFNTPRELQTPVEK